MKVKRPPIIGIDLGTTYSLVGAMQGGAPVLFPNVVGEVLTPSAVSIDDDGRVLVGAPARARAATHPDATALAFKRDMGTERTYRLAGATYRPVDLSALVLKSLIADAEQALGMPIEEAVITVPAYFGDAQRQATRMAGEIAGIRVERIVNEPTAAALAFGLANLGRELSAVVVDLGGGTFDVTVLDIMEGVIEIRASAGDARLGGDDFTEALAEHFAAQLASEAGLTIESGKSRARVREAAELAKKRLANDERVAIGIPKLEGRERARDVELAIDRTTAIGVWSALLGRLNDPIRRALRDAQIAPERVDEVLLVGGATRMKNVVELVARLFGRVPRTDLPPDEAVARGAAIQAGLKEGDAAVDDLVVTDVAPFTMGIATATKLGTRHVDGLFTPVLERGTVIPASRVERFHTMEDNQRELLVQVFQGEHSLCRDNAKLGELLVDRLPRGRAGEVWLDIRFTYDLNGLLEVDASVMGTDRVEQLVIEKRPGMLSKKEIDAARAAMGRIKFHPRDSLPNRTALARADALYVELTGPAREDLGRAIAIMRAALETQDPKEIDPAREQLNAIIAALR
jgi:molecular chaperone HscC